MTIPLPPVPGPEITPRNLLTPPWHSWFSQLYVYLTQPSAGGGGIVPASRKILTTTPLTGGGDLSADRTHSLIANGVTNALLAQMPASTLKGNNTAGLANAADLTVGQAQALLAVPVGASPSALAGLSAIPGVATTFTRSDGAPALDQTIIPTWTGLHTFNGKVVVGKPVSGTALTVGDATNAITNATIGLLNIAVGQSFNSNACEVNTTGTVVLDIGTVGAAELRFWTNDLVRATVGTGGNVTINAPTSGAAQSLPAGTTAVYPLLINSGVQLTTPVAGGLEYDGTCAYFTPFATSRGVNMTEFMQCISGAYTLTSQTAAQKLLNATTNGAITLPIGVYEFECAFSLTAMSASAGAFGFALGGSSTHTDAWWCSADKTTTLATAVATALTSFNTAANVAVSPSNTSTVGWAQVRGIIRVTVAGTIIPQVSLGVAAAAVVGANSFFRILPVGPSGFTTVGQWT